MRRDVFNREGTEIHEGTVGDDLNVVIKLQRLGTVYTIICGEYEKTMSGIAKALDRDILQNIAVASDQASYIKENRRNIASGSR